VDSEQAQKYSSTFKRGQVTSALWYAYAGVGFHAAPKVPRSFARRLSKFTELGLWFGVEHPGTGVDREFTFWDAFEFGIALDLQDIGLNQLEIVRWLLRNRELIRSGFSDLKMQGAVPVYLLVRSRTILEARRAFESLSPADWAGATIGEPVIVEGLDALEVELKKLGGRDRKRIVVELTDLASSVAVGLTMAPRQQRGRR
jgi:hypothetical protein